jgi:hypothetical protein
MQPWQSLFISHFDLWSSLAYVTLLYLGLAYCEQPQPLSLFYGSGRPFPKHEIRVPFELQWGVTKLAEKLDSGSVSSLDVVEAIKTAMPVDWLHAHHMLADSVSIIFAMRDEDIVEVYRAALNAWGADDVIEPAAQTSSDNGISGRGHLSSLPAAPLGAVAVDEPPNQAKLLLRIVRLLASELEFCSTSLIPDTELELFQLHQTALSIECLVPLQSTLISSMFKAASGRNSDIEAWRAFARQLPYILDHSCRLQLFRVFTKTTPQHMQDVRQDRVNGIERSQILDWAAAIAAATRGRRNPLMVQYAHENGYGEAITSSFFCDVADAFSFADLGMWYVYGDDAPEIFSDDAHRPLLASNGLFPQPYCASRPMPAGLLHNFKLLGCLMGKALHDRRAFPLRISYALARCICGQDLQFEDLGAILSPSQFDCLSRLRAYVEGGAAFPSDAIAGFGQLEVFCHVAAAGSGRLAVCGFELVPDGGNVDLCESNAPLFLKAFERFFLRDGVSLQIRALRDGFYSVVSREAVSLLGASGLLRELSCLEVASFDADDVKFGLLPAAGFDVDSPQFQWLIKSMLQFNEHERSTFLRWVKGGPSLPSGFKGLPQPIRVVGMHVISICPFIPLAYKSFSSANDRFGCQS